MAVPQPESDWQFLQCFGERTPGEDIQEGVHELIGGRLRGVHMHDASVHEIT